MAISPEMTEFPEPKHVRFDEASMWVTLNDGRVVGVPLAWYPRLLHATPEQLARVELSPSGMHWDEIDEDLSVRGILMGQMAFRPQPATVAR